MSANLNDIYKSLGALTSHVETLIEANKLSNDAAAKSVEKADTQRAAMHRRIDDLVKDVSELKADFEVVQADVKEAKEVTDDVVRWKQMGMGAIGATGMAAAAISSLITYKWAAIVNWFMGR